MAAPLISRIVPPRTWHSASLFVPTAWLDPEQDGAGGVHCPGDDRFMSSGDLRACVDSGLVDVQSHGHRHALVNVGTQLAGFASPEFLSRFDLYDWPMQRAGDVDRLGAPPLGTPIYEAAPLLSAPHRLLEDPSVRAACVEHVASHGGERFFASGDWRSELEGLHDEVSRASSGFERVPDAEFRELVASEFQLSIERLEGKVGIRSRYVAYPWMLGSESSLELAAEHGIRTVFGVGIDFRRARRWSRPEPRVYGRYRSDWLRFLPGEGRRSLLRALPGKLRGFLSNQHLAHRGGRWVIEPAA